MRTFSLSPEVSSHDRSELRDFSNTVEVLREPLYPDDTEPRAPSDRDTRIIRRVVRPTGGICASLLRCSGFRVPLPRQAAPQGKRPSGLPSPVNTTTNRSPGSSMRSGWSAIRPAKRSLRVDASAGVACMNR